MSNNLALCSVHTSSAMYGDRFATKPLGCGPSGNRKVIAAYFRQDFERIQKQ